MKNEKLYDGITGIREDIVERADAHEFKKKKRMTWQKWTALAACFCLVVGGVYGAARLGLLGGAGNSAPEEPDNAEEGASGYYGDLSGGIRPEILVGDTVFYWTGMAQAIHGATTPYGQVYTVGNAETFLPDGYTEYGSIASVTDADVTEQLQMKAGFEATGTVYISTGTPEAVYVLMSTDWFENYYIRFVSSELDDGHRIVWDGKDYRIGIGDGTCDILEELPENSELIGTLHFVGIDAIPESDLETNCPNDTYSFALEGREVFFDSSDPNFIYVYERHYWSGGEYDTYLKCPLWTD